MRFGKTQLVSLIDCLSVSFFRKLDIEDRKQYYLTCYQFVDLVIKATSRKERCELRMGGYIFFANSLW